MSTADERLPVQKDLAKAGHRWRLRLLAPWLIALVAGCSEPLPPSAPQNRLQALALADKFDELESHLAALHGRHERGEISENVVRNEYRAFYQSSPELERAFNRWVALRPDSYIAALTLGLHYRIRTMAARGNGWGNTSRLVGGPESTLGGAEQELVRAMTLHPRPWMAAFGLMDMYGVVCRRDELAALADRSLAFAPDSALLRLRRIHYLKPRWCGSYEQMDAFVGATQAGGAPEAIVLQLRAMVQDDKGRSAVEANQWDRAVPHLLEAARLARQVGGDFQRDWLSAVNEYRCSRPELATICQP